MSLPNTLVVMPRGEYYCPYQDCWMLFDDKAIQDVARAVGRQANSMGDNFPGLLLDFDGASYDLKRSSQAAGWL